MPIISRESGLPWCIPISQVYQILTGCKPRRTGADRSRARATWRGGDGWNVALDDARGVWNDFARNEGGGVLDLISRVRGGTRQSALKWLAASIGVTLDSDLSRAERARWAGQQRELGRELPLALHWRRAAILLAEELLDSLKVGFFDSGTGPTVEASDLRNLTCLLAELRRIDGLALVEEYRWWVRTNPVLSRGLVYTAEIRSEAERRALHLFLAGAAEADRS
jgi:hypothetical protein